MPLLQKVVEGAKEEFADAVANGGGMYAVGYCFGGKYILLLAHDQDQTDVEKGTVKKEPVIKAGALAHGSALLRSKSSVAYCFRYHGHKTRH